jgi:hypothetical protein
LRSEDAAPVALDVDPLVTDADRFVGGGCRSAGGYFLNTVAPRVVTDGSLRCSSADYFRLVTGASHPKRKDAVYRGAEPPFVPQQNRNPWDAAHSN